MGGLPLANGNGSGSYRAGAREELFVHRIIRADTTCLTTYLVADLENGSIGADMSDMTFSTNGAFD